MKTSLKHLCFAVTSLVIGTSLRASAEVEITVAIPDFNESEQTVVYTNGDATLDKGGLRLTAPRGTSAGGGFYKVPVAVSSHRSFSSYFTFRMTDPQCGSLGKGGADGLAFVIQPDIDSLGRKGGGIGYQEVPASLAVEFDTFQNRENNDPEKHHVGISLNGNAESVAVIDAPFTLNNGKIYHAWIDYDGKVDSLEVRLADANARPAEPLIKHTVDLEAVLSAGQQYVGFTASTGTCFEQHDVFSMYFNTDNFVNGIDTATESYVMTAR